MPFDKGLPLAQRILWRIAEKYNITAADVLMEYFEWKNQCMNRN
jgi:hypothetical protein